MTFISFSYLLFLPVVYLIFYFTADRWRWLVLLSASYGFYASMKAPYLLAVLVTVTAISYACGLRIAAYEDESIRRRWLWIGSISCIAILAVLKYFPFLASQAGRFGGLDRTLSSTIVNVGVSYFTFQAVSYLADVYLEIQAPERHWGRYALYMAFFPKLLQGPIERAGNLLPQLCKRYEFSYDDVRSGMLLFIWGLFKKVVMADRIGLYVDTVYNDVYSFTGLPLLLATYAYALQIYIDFSSYTDMALGSAKLFSINLTQNFNHPYRATSVADFWRRWHISFSRWILDYIFKPLQMQWRNWNSWGTAAALLVTFAVSGIWHGARWGFLVWGGLHGLYMACSAFYRPYQHSFHKKLGIQHTKLLLFWQTVFTFNLVSFAWIFFRSASLREALYVVLNILPDLKTLKSAMALKLAIKEFIMHIGFGEFKIAVASLMIMLVINKLFCDISHESRRIPNMPKYRRWIVYYSIMILILFFGLYNSSSSFIYLQF